MITEKMMNDFESEFTVCIDLAKKLIKQNKLQPFTVGLSQGENENSYFIPDVTKMATALFLAKQLDSFKVILNNVSEANRKV